MKHMIRPRWHFRCSRGLTFVVALLATTPLSEVVEYRVERQDEDRQPAYAAPTAETLRTTMHSATNLIRLLL
jgi:hypothetical protein